MLARVASLLPLLSLDQKLHQLLRGAAFNATSTPATGIGMLEMGAIFAGAASPSAAAALRAGLDDFCMQVSCSVALFV